MGDIEIPDSVSDREEAAIKDMVKYEAQLAFEIHAELEAEHPEVAAAIGPADLLPKVDDALKWLKDKF